MSFPPLVRQDLGLDLDPIAGIGLLGDQTGESAAAVRQLGAMLLATRPQPSFCTADTAVSSAAFVSVTGMAQSKFCPLHGDLGVEGLLYVQEDTPGKLSVQILNGSSVIWGPVTVQEQGALGLVGTEAQNGQWLVSIGGPNLIEAAGGSVYTLDVQIAAPAGAYTVLTGTGKESHISAMLWPTVGVTL